MTRFSDDEAYLVGLLRKIAQRDERAFREFMYRFNTRIHGLVWNKLRSAEDAEEVLADTFVAVWNSAHTFEGRSTVATWIVGIAERRVLMKLRSSRKHESHDDIDEVGETLEGDVPDSVDVIAARQHLEFFEDCVSKLSSRHRDCLILHLRVGLSDAEIAIAIGEPLGTVKSRLHHAKRNVTRCVQGKLSPPGQH